MLAGVGLISTPGFYAYGQVKNKSRIDKISIGLRAGSNNIIAAPGSKSQIGISNSKSIVVNKPLSAHLKVEATINYNMLMNGCCIDKIFGRKLTNDNQATITLPVTTQYFPLKRQSRVQPYLGAGFQYSMETRSKISARTSDIMDNQSADGNKYISLIFMQGVTYKVNTKIEVYETTIFNANSTTNIGLNIGVGYKLQ